MAALVWMLGVVLAGAILTSFHQPFQAADQVVLEHSLHSGHGDWHAVHLLSGACACSQRNMKRLLRRKPFASFTEEVVLVDDGTPYLDGSQELLDRLSQVGYSVRHLTPSDLSADTGVRGVPLLLVFAPSGAIAYSGGYGEPDQAVQIFDHVEHARPQDRLAVFGCAVGRRSQVLADPLGLKYRKPFLRWPSLRTFFRHTPEKSIEHPY